MTDISYIAYLIYTVGHKKGATFIFTITLANVNRFQ